MERGRWTVENPLDPDLRDLGRTRFLRAKPGGLGAHAHPGGWEIVLVLSGTVEWWAGDERWTVGPGRYFLTRPNEPHGGEGAVMNPCELRWMVVADGRAAPWLAGLPRSGPAPAALGQAFAALLEEHALPGERAAEAVGAWLTVALASLRRPPPEATDPALAPAVAAARADLGGDWPLARLADVSGYSVPRFCARFREAYGEPPARWLRRERIAAARRLLTEGKSVGETAQAVGFATPQRFATAFRAEMGLTPREWALTASAPGPSLLPLGEGWGQSRLE